MPSERFFNLSSEKRERIKNATISELSRVDYEEISINKIIKNADIPRGSFYEYFQDKSDLINYIMDDYKNNMIENIKKSFTLSNGDIFKVFQDAFFFAVNFGFAKENYQFCSNIFASLKISKCHDFENILIHKETMIKKFSKYINTDDLNIDNKEDLECILEILINTVRNQISTIFSDPQSKEKYIKDFEKKLNYIKYGALKIKCN